MYEEYKELVDEFFEQKDLKWGVLLREIVLYINDRLGINLASSDPIHGKAYWATSAYATRRYSISKQWRLLGPALLQPHKGRYAFGDKGVGTYKRKLKSRHIREGAQILSINKKYALARLFFEIEEDIEKLRAEEDVAKGCGYLVIKALYEKEPQNAKKVLENLGFAQVSFEEKGYLRKFEESRINRLREINFIKETEKGYVLYPDIRAAYKHMLEVKDKIAAWNYRDNWILPYEKK